MEYTFELFSSIPSKKNLLGLNRGKFYIKKSKEIDALVLEIMSQKKKYPKAFPLEGELSWSVQLKASDKRDFMNELSTLADILQDSGVISNDRQIKHFKEPFYKEKGAFPYCKIIIQAK